MMSHSYTHVFSVESAVRRERYVISQCTLPQYLTVAVCYTITFCLQHVWYTTSWLPSETHLWTAWCRAVNKGNCCQSSHFSICCSCSPTDTCCSFFSTTKGHVAHQQRLIKQLCLQLSATPLPQMTILVPHSMYPEKPFVVAGFNMVLSLEWHTVTFSRDITILPGVDGVYIICELTFSPGFSMIRVHFSSRTVVHPSECLCTAGRMRCMLLLAPCQILYVIIEPACICWWIN